MSIYAVLDTRGLLLHSYFKSTRKTIETKDGFAPSWEDGLFEFVTEYLTPILKDFAPRQVFACFDGGNNARRRLYVGYKARRTQRDKEQDPAISEQLKLLMEHGRRLLAYLGCRTVQVPGEEADDLIALIVSRIEADGFTIFTRDGDLVQLADDRTWVNQMGTLYGIVDGPFEDAGVESSFKGIPFDLIALYKAIVGDSSDEYPGVKGAGPKFFESLMTTYGHEVVRKLSTHVEQGDISIFEGTECTLFKKLRDNWSDLCLQYKIAKVNPDNCYGSINDRRKEPEWYVRIPSKQVVSEILDTIGIQKPEWDWLFPTEILIDANNCSHFPAIMAEVVASPIVSYDFETADKLKHSAFRAYKEDFVDVLSSELVSVSVNYGRNLEKTIYVTFDHAESHNLTKDWAQWLLNSLQVFRPRAVVQNAAFELSVTATSVGLDLSSLVVPYDTAIMASYVDENGDNHLKEMSQTWLNYKQTTYREVTGGRSMHELTALEALSYGCDDSLVTSHLFDVFRHIMQMEGSWEFYNQYEVDWASDNVGYFIDGTDVDFDLLHSLHADAKRRFDDGMAFMHERLAEYCNASHTQETAMAAATLLLQEWWAMEQHKPKIKADPQAAQDAYQRLFKRAWEGCFYTPPTQRVVIKFAPTAAQLTAVALLIDKALPPIPSASARGIENWAIDASDVLDMTENLRHVDPLAYQFVELLNKARKFLAAKSREGDAYTELERFCLTILQERGDLKQITDGDQLNTNSDVQMQCLLYGKLQLPLRRRSKAAYGSTRHRLGLEGAPSTGIKAIQAAFVHDITDEDDWRADVLRSYLDVAKVSQEISLYYESYPLLVHPKDGRVHPQIKNCGTVTRRPSGTTPNVLQVSKSEGAKIRKIFRGGDYGDGERVYVCIDFASQELVITACESQDPVMLDAFMSSPRKDLHSLTSTGFAHTILSRWGIHLPGPVSYDEFVRVLHDSEDENAKRYKEVRNKYGKPCNFLIAYGGAPSTLAGNLLIPLDFAKELMEGVFSLYSRIQPWQQESIEFAMRHGYTLTAYGNKRHAEKGLWDSDRSAASRAQRQLINAQIQGTAADILKLVLTEMRRREMRQRYRLKALKPVYDEISASVPVELAVEYALELSEVMSITPPGYPVGMAVDISIGRTWGEVIEVGGTDRQSITAALDTVMGS